MAYHQPATPIDELPLFAYSEPEPEPVVPDYQPATPGKQERDAERILTYLQKHGAVGKDNAVLGNELVARLGLGKSTSLRNAVKHLRDNGYLVLATIAGGYYIAKDVAELREFLDDNYKNRIIAMIESGNAMINHARAVYGAPANELLSMRLEHVEHKELPEGLRN